MTAVPSQLSRRQSPAERRVPEIPRHLLRLSHHVVSGAADSVQAVPHASQCRTRPGASWSQAPRTKLWDVSHHATGLPGGLSLMAAALARTLRAPRTRPRPVLRVRSPADRSAGHHLSPAASQAPAGHRRWSFHIRVPGRFAWHELLRTKTERGGSPFSGSRPRAATGGFLSAAAGLTSTFRLSLRLGRALSRANHFTIPIITGSDRATRCGILSGRLRPGTALADPAVAFPAGLSFPQEPRRQDVTDVPSAVNADYTSFVEGTFASA
jgi:hypothetical protein